MKTRNVAIGIALAVVVLLAVGLLIGGWLGGMNAYGLRTMMGGHGFPLGMHTIGGGILMLIFWGALIGGVVLLAASLARQGEKPSGSGEMPLDILKRRYAAGEIDREEFERMREVLLS
jgi:putative membrane protein